MAQKDTHIRKDKILAMIIDSYISTAEPIASRAISKKLRMSLSPASVRNIMSDLEEQGLIMHPHTSAGRMPTEKGYRHYIDKLMRASLLTEEEKRLVDKEFDAKVSELNSLLDKTSGILSSITNQAGVVFLPLLQKSPFRHVELVKLGPNEILAVLIMSSGVTKDFVVFLDDDIQAQELSRINNFINKYMGKNSLNEIRQEIVRKLIAERDSFFYVLERAKAIIDIILDVVKENRIYLDGRFHITEQPEFENVEKVKSLLKHLESKDFLFSLLKKISDREAPGVYIGSELGEEFSDCSMIASDYRVGDIPCGILGIIGPKRMEYARLVSIVDYVAEKLSRILK
ncbi:MAG: heat-inducible transcriptional repressor HrcA [Candidatus Omnitrophica bacterium]|nr:heat-inducible transcriptional repressor HrcA [Candidatus Omnitrophota bacterium]